MLKHFLKIMVIFYLVNSDTFLLNTNYNIKLNGISHTTNERL